MIRTVQLEVTYDTLHDNILGLIPSSYFLCTMYDNNSTTFQIITEDTDNINLSDYNVSLRLWSGYVELGTFLVSDPGYEFNVSSTFTQESTLEVQVLLSPKNTNTDTIVSTNTVKFYLIKSGKPTDEVYQNRAYLNKAIDNGQVVLKVEDTDLYLYDDLGNEIGKVDIYDQLNGYM